MPTPAERHALLFLAVIAITGGGVRVAGANRFTRELTGAEHLAGGSIAGSVGDRALTAQLDAIDSAREARSRRPPRASASARSRRRPDRSDSSSSGQVPRIFRQTVPPHLPLLVDVNRATLAELERLPRVGPALAERIIRWRDEHGPYRSLQDLRHVRGIGPTTVALLAPVVTF